MSKEFEGRRVLVTGGANGLGKSIVQKFYENGATVFAMDFDEAGLSQLKLEFPNVTPIKVDLSDWDATRKAIDAILPLHHLVNNAGVYRQRGVMSGTCEDIDFTFNVNFKAPFNLIQAFANGVIAAKLDGATIVNISSTADRLSITSGSGIYGTSKAALTMLTKAAAYELGQYNIRVNCIRPTAMATTMFAQALSENPRLAESTKAFLDRAVIKTQLKTSDSAELVYFLSSSKSSIITGEDVAIDGGTGL